MTKVLFKRKNSDEIANLAVEDGALIYNYETGATYLDYDNERIPTGGGGEALLIGTIIPYTGSTIPNGYLLCDGSAVSRTTYSMLFSVIGTTYGSGDGSTTFNLPNLKGRVVAGQDATQTEFDTLGETGGEKTHTLTVSEMPSHNHLFKFTKEIADPATGSGEIFFGKARAWNMGDNGNITEDSGGGAAHNILQPYIVLKYIIKATKEQAGSTMSESLPVGTELDFDGTTNDIPEGWEEVTNPDSYSTSEIKTNKIWIDGKPIYSKVIDLGTLPNGTSKNVAHNISNLGTVIRLSAMTVGDNRFVIPETRNQTYPEYQVGLWCNSTNIVIETGTDRTNTSAFAIIEYTKTTE